MTIFLELFGDLMITLRYQHFEYVQGVGYELLILFMVVEHLLDGSEVVSHEAN